MTPEATGYPWSGEAVRQFVAELREDEGAAVMRLLRRRWPLELRNLWRGRIWRRDPARRFLQDEAWPGRLQEMLAVPEPVSDEPPKEPDEWDRLLAMQQDTQADEPAKPVSLGTVCRVVEATMGAGWYYNPDRWPTWDGYAPYKAVWEAWRTIQQVRALDRLDMIRAVGVTKSGDRAASLYDATVREALGGG